MLDYQSLCLQGSACHQAGRLQEARELYESVLSVAPPSYELLHNLGTLCRQLGDFSFAKEWLEKALSLRPDALMTLDELALVCQESGDIPAALVCYERALRIDPRHHQAFAGMGEAFSDAGWEIDGVRAFKTALEIEPNQVNAMNGLGVLYKRMAQFDLALECFDRALSLCPNDPGLELNRAQMLGAQGGLDGEESVYRQMLVRDPEDVDVHFSLATLLLLSGRWDEGWREYEWRFKSRQSGESVRSPVTRLPRWQGEHVSRDAGLIIYAEQGFGDGIQFFRFVSLAAERFGRVRLQARKPLLALFCRSLAGGVEVVADTSPDETGFTHHCPLLSLPLALSMSLDSLPATVPYLFSDPDKRSRWRSLLVDDPRLKIGVTWTTGKKERHKRSFELNPSLLAPLFAIKGIRWISLSKEPLGPDRRAELESAGVSDWSSDLSDFDDTAALIDVLDLVISVDTATAHLAGALGKPVWLLNRAESEWRWLLKRTDSPWYPSMRIVRQQQSRQWGAVVEEVQECLLKLVKGCGES